MRYPIPSTASGTAFLMAARTCSSFGRNASGCAAMYSSTDLGTLCFVGREAPYTSEPLSHDQRDIVRLRRPGGEFGQRLRDCLHDFRSGFVAMLAQNLDQFVLAELVVRVVGRLGYAVAVDHEHIALFQALALFAIRRDSQNAEDRSAAFEHL